MSQDTRKDRRAKVVSLNVRYKSATIDEFIENHSHDVSQGGLFVKTPTPFPPGTLLKFEIRLAGDMSVISGVGRVVWKREPAQSGTDKPAGMGVKFIKIDDQSRVIIDRLVASKSGAGSAYTSEQPVMDDPPAPATLRGIVAAPASAGPPGPPPTAGGTGAGVGLRLPHSVVAVPPPVQRNPRLGATLVGTGLAASPPAPSVATSSPPHRASAAPDPGAEANPEPPTTRHTVVGMGEAPTLPAAVRTPLGTPAPPPAAPSPPVVTAPAAEPMFPAAVADMGEPARDQTVMRQAAELLEEALKEAGGSLDEIGDNALFARRDRAEPPRVGGHGTMIMAAPSRPSEPQQRTAASSVQAGSSPSQPLILGAPAPATSTRKLSDDLATSKKSGGSVGLLLGLLALVLIGGGAVYAWQSGMLGAAGSPARAVSGPVSAPPPSPPGPPGPSLAPPVVAATDAGLVVKTDAATTSVDASAAGTGTEAGVTGHLEAGVTSHADADAGATGHVNTGEVRATPAPAPAKPRPRPRPKPAPTPAEPSEAEETAPAPAPAPAPIEAPAPMAPDPE